MVWKCKLGVRGWLCDVAFAFGGALREESHSSPSCSAQGPVKSMIEQFICLGKRWFATWEAAGALLSSCPKSNPQMTWNKMEGSYCVDWSASRWVKTNPILKKSATCPLWILESSVRPPAGRRLWNVRGVSIKLVVWSACKDYSRLLRAKWSQVFLFPWDLHWERCPVWCQGDSEVGALLLGCAVSLCSAQVSGPWGS